MRLSLPVGILFALASASAGAQSLEESYAKLCTEASASESEACTALRKALMAKLQQVDSAGQAPATPATPTPAAPTSTRASVPAPADLAGWGALARLAGKKYAWHAGRARGSHEKELTLHRFFWGRDGALRHKRCSYWPQHNMRPACGTHLIERQSNGQLLMKANGGKPHFIGTVAADGSVEFVNKTFLGTFVDAFRAQPDGSIVLEYQNKVDGRSGATLLQIDAAGEARVLAELAEVHQLIQEQKREAAERRYQAILGGLMVLNSALEEVARETSRQVAAQAQHDTMEADAQAQAGAAAAGQAPNASASRLPAPPKPATSAAASPLGGPTVSGSGGSTCNEEIACRSLCAGDVVAITQCAKKCASESACRVSIQ